MVALIARKVVQLYFPASMGIHGGVLRICNKLVKKIRQGYTKYRKKIARRVFVHVQPNKTVWKGLLQKVWRRLACKTRPRSQAIKQKLSER